VSENRQHPRKSVASEVAFQLENGSRLAARCRDVSLGGMFIETATPAPYGTPLRVYARLPGLRGEAVIDAIVRWAKPDGMGVQFGSMGARETHALTVLLSGG
jgi:PilZ domain